MPRWARCPPGGWIRTPRGCWSSRPTASSAHRIISPRHEVGKVYYARLDGELTDEDVAALEAGIHIRDADGEFDARPAKLRRDGGDAAYIRVTEGKYHQVKRMFAARGKHVVYLKRMAIGSLALDPELKPGEWRELTDDEVSSP